MNTDVLLSTFIFVLKLQFCSEQSHMSIVQDMTSLQPSHCHSKCNVKSWTSEHLHWPVATHREQGSHCSCSQLAIMLSSPRSAAQATTVKPTESFVAECKGCVGLPLPICVGFVLVFNLYDPAQVTSICTSKRISTLLQSTTMNKYKVHVRLELQCCSFEISLLLLRKVSAGQILENNILVNLKMI